MRSLIEISDQGRLMRFGESISVDDQNSFIRTREVISADFLYERLAATASDSDPIDLKNSCKLTKKMRAIHFSHDACEKISFCQEHRGPALESWLDAWRGHCVPGVSL